MKSEKNHILYSYNTIINFGMYQLIKSSKVRIYIYKSQQHATCIFITSMKSCEQFTKRLAFYRDTRAPH